jgi:hypothetical protein
VPPSAITAKAPAPTEVQYRTYFDYDYAPYTYRAAYRYGGYTYWYPSYRIWAYPSDLLVQLVVWPCAAFERVLRNDLGS